MSIGGVTLTVEPGTTIEFNKYTNLYIEGNLICNGTEEKPIFINHADENGPIANIEIVTDSNGYAEISYAYIDNLSGAVSVIDHCYIQNYISFPTTFDKTTNSVI